MRGRGHIVEVQSTRGVALTREGVGVLGLGFGVFSKGTPPPPSYLDEVSAVFVIVVVLGWVLWSCYEILRLRR